MTRRLAALCAVVLFAVACSSPTPPPDRVPDKLTLFSTEIEPTHGATEKELFHRHAVLGKVEITDAEERAKVWKAVREAITDRPHSVHCFDPRHALRATFGAVEVDLLLCFECKGVYEFRGDARVRDVTLSSAPKALLNQILADAKIPIVPERKKE